MPDDQEIPEIIKQLLHAEAYPHPVTEPVRLEQTHIPTCCSLENGPTK